MSPVLTAPRGRDPIILPPLKEPPWRRWLKSAIVILLFLGFVAIIAWADMRSDGAEACFARGGTDYDGIARVCRQIKVFP